MNKTNPELSKLRWQCRRGIKELDILLSDYLEHDYPNANENEKQQFKTLLSLEDPLLAQLLFSTIKEDNSMHNSLLQKRQRQ